MKARLRKYQVGLTIPAREDGMDCWREGAELMRFVPQCAPPAECPATFLQRNTKGTLTKSRIIIV